MCERCQRIRIRGYFTAFLDSCDALRANATGQSQRGKLIFKVVQIIKHSKNLAIVRDIRGRATVVRMMNPAVDSNDDDRRHPAELEQLELLAERLKPALVRIWHAREGKVFLLPVFSEFIRGIGSDCDDLSVTAGELGVVLTQLRQMPAADRSPEPSHKHEHDVLTASKLL